MNGVPIVLFGAFDRHNLGDFLLARAACLQAGAQPCLFAGLQAADLTACGGFVVEPVRQILADWPRRFGDAPMELVHVGGEILDTDAWEAAVMLLAPERARSLVARLDGDPAGRAAWAGEFLGSGSPAPYVLDRRDMPKSSSVIFRAVGGVGLAGRDPVFRQVIEAALSTADRVTVRDRRTLAAVTGLGIRARLEMDPAMKLGPWLAEEINAVPPVGDDYVAVQFAAALGDDATLEALAVALNAHSRPVVLFRAGAAPWHDDLAVFERLAQRLRLPVQIMDSLHVRDICATIARARLCVASSLHAILLAGLFSVPAIGLERRLGEGTKLRAYAETWGGFDIATPDAILNRMVGYGTAG